MVKLANQYACCACYQVALHPTGRQGQGYHRVMKYWVVPLQDSSIIQKKSRLWLWHHFTWAVMSNFTGQVIVWSTDGHPKLHINSLCPSDAIWHPGSGSTLAQVMACCLTAPSHYLNQCWLISKVQWHASHKRYLNHQWPKLAWKLLT